MYHNATNILQYFCIKLKLYSSVQFQLGSMINNLNFVKGETIKTDETMY